jgi:hypothetical protein
MINEQFHGIMAKSYGHLELSFLIIGLVLPFFCSAQHSHHDYKLIATMPCNHPMGSSAFPHHPTQALGDLQSALVSMFCSHQVMERSLTSCGRSHPAKWPPLGKISWYTIGPTFNMLNTGSSCHGFVFRGQKCLLAMTLVPLNPRIALKGS